MTSIASPDTSPLITSPDICADVPVISAYLMMVAVTFIALNLLADLLCFALDPRLRPQHAGQGKA